MTSSGLIPCPFCGAIDGLKISTSNIKIGYKVVISCNNCDLEMTTYGNVASRLYSTTLDAVKYWNERANV